MARAKKAKVPEVNLDQVLEEVAKEKGIEKSALIETIESALGRKAVVEYRESNRADVKSTWANVSKAHRVLDWAPKVSLEQGIEKTVAWYLENRELVDSLDLGVGGGPPEQDRAAA